MSQPCEQDVLAAPAQTEVASEMRHTFISTVQYAFALDISAELPKVNPLWREKTHEFMTQRYELLSPIAKRSAHALSALGNVFPECGTLETLTRSILRTNTVDPEHIVNIFERFQQQSRKSGNHLLFQGSLMLAFMPVLNSGQITTHEGELLRAIVSLLPPLIFASAKSSSENNTSSGERPKMTVQEEIHMRAMNSRYGEDSSGRKWLTETRSKQVFGSTHPASQTKKK